MRRYGRGVGVPVSEAVEEGPVNVPDLFTSYWSNPALRHTDAVKVSISRGQPRWPLPFTYRRATLLAPSRETFRLRSDEAFTEAYLAELEEAGVAKIGAMLKRISHEEGGGPLVLLCWEKPGDFCHRSLFSSWWESKTGEPVEELRCGSSHKRQEPQERLF